MSIDPTARIAPGAELAPDVTVGPGAKFYRLTKP